MSQLMLPGAARIYAGDMVKWAIPLSWRNMVFEESSRTFTGREPDL